MCLPLLPADDISPMFRELRKEAKKVNRVAFNPFMEYFYDQWIEKLNFI